MPGSLKGCVACLRWRTIGVWASFRVVGGEERVVSAAGLEVGDEVPEGSSLIEVTD